MSKTTLDMNIEIQLGSKTINVQDLLSIEESNLSNEYAAQPSRYAYFAVLAVHAKKAYLQAKAAREEEEADAFIEYKDTIDLIPKGGRTVSDDLANRHTILDEDVQKAKAYELDMEHRWRLMEAIANAFIQRAGQLQSMGAHLRHEEDMTGMETPSYERDLQQHVRRTRKSN